ncbi:hypothetical protein PV328_007768 [Microctonus aethiopoides]|uniref:Uncharacterized protein n=1 Tax=Microctonus aethiopoides TaxID=144406 RepID=A0AA39C9F1_9HYME|nr:hypothetical protein PV328_007768 [Microctonus aethiopoides]
MKYDCGVDTSCSTCEYIHDCFGIIVGMTSDMSQKAKDLMMTLYHMKRHIEGKPFSDDTRNAVMDGEATATKEYSITKTSFTQEMDVSIIQDLVYNMIHESNSIFMVSEQLKQFIIDRK